MKIRKMIEIKQITADKTWDLRQRVMWPTKPKEFVILHNDEDGFHYGLFENQHLISVVSLFRNGHLAQFRKFATEVDYQGKGYGTKLLRYLMEEAKLLKINLLCCDARLSAIGFYEKFGMKVASDVFLKNEKDYVKMEIILSKEKDDKRSN
jgi:GNAT superfamily N-acetyltransferase